MELEKIINFKDNDILSKMTEMIDKIYLPML